ncbi:DUF2207 domain-containing protein [Glaciihabitans arcticus]|uniref:DUF2207 domain-containing protein n=1 Tax=Glaciihabitans arcticus TaxID=2668039 RepID=UPI0012AB99C9|nr:DUF2207 domain-containing protein [Glaciihabitans arcticus]
MRLLLAVLVGVGLAVLPLGAAHADTSDFEFESYHADYTLTRAEDGTSRLAVVETLVALFPNFDQNRGIIRAIPQYSQGMDLETSVSSVQDETGTAVPFEANDTGEFLELALGDDDFVQGRTTYVISYTQSNVVSFFENTNDDEFYWDLNGTGSDQPYDTVSADLHVDPALVDALTGESACYYGAFESDATCTVSSAAPGEFSVSQSDLGPRENVSIVIVFQPRTFVMVEKTAPDFDAGPAPVVFTDPPWWSNLFSGGGILGAIALAAGAIVSRVRGGRDAASRFTVIPQYSVPKGLNVMMAAHLVGKPETAIPAQLISLAVRKKIRILDYAVTDSAAEYTLQFLDSSDVDALEAELLDALFGAEHTPGETRELAPADAALGAAVNAVSASAKSQVSSSGLRGPLPKAPILFIGLGFLLFFGAVGNIILTIGSNAISVWPFVAAGVSFVSIFIGFLAIRPVGPLTAQGAELNNYLLGMKMYLELAEKDRFRMLQSPDGAERVDVGDTKQVIKLYEKLLPFAVIWNVEDQWMHELAVHTAAEGTEPDWLVSSNGFDGFVLSNALRSVTTAATYTPPASTSSWSGSGSGSSSFGSSFGGSGGGGFSGGGGGGGGAGGR